MRWRFWRKSTPSDKLPEPTDKVVCPGCDQPYDIMDMPVDREITVVCMVCDIQFDVIPRGNRFELHVRAI